MSPTQSSSYLDLASQSLIISLNQQIVDLQKNVKNVTIAHTGEMLRTNALQEEIQSYKDKINDFQPTVTLLNNKIADLTHDKFIQEFQISKLLNEIEVLKTELSTYEVKLYKQGHSKQTVFMNQPKKFKSYDDKDGLGFDNPGTLSKVQSEIPSLYKDEYFRYGMTMNFVRVSNEELNEENLKRSTHTNNETSFDYDNLNASYSNRKLTFSHNDFHTKSVPDLTTPEPSSSEKDQVVFQSAQTFYIPPLVLEKHVADLHIELESEKTCFINKEDKLLKKIDQLRSINSKLETQLANKPSPVTPSLSLNPDSPPFEPKGVSPLVTPETASSSSDSTKVNIHQSISDQEIDDFIKSIISDSSTDSDILSTGVTTPPTPVVENVLLNNSVLISNGVSVDSYESEVNFDTFMNHTHVFDKDFEKKFTPLDSTTRFAPSSYYSKQTPQLPRQQAPPPNKTSSHQSRPLATLKTTGSKQHTSSHPPPRHSHKPRSSISNKKSSTNIRPNVPISKQTTPSLKTKTPLPKQTTPLPKKNAPPPKQTTPLSIKTTTPAQQPKTPLKQTTQITKQNKHPLKLSNNTGPSSSSRKPSTESRPSVSPSSKSTNAPRKVHTSRFSSNPLQVSRSVNGKVQFRDQYGWFSASPKISQSTNYSLQKDKRHSKKPHSSGTLNHSNLHFPKTSRVWTPSQSVSPNPTQTKSFKYSFSELFALAPNDFVRHSPTILKSPLIPQKLFQNETPCFKSKWNATSLDQSDTTSKCFSKVFKTIGPVLKWVPKVA